MDSSTVINGVILLGIFSGFCFSFLLWACRSCAQRKLTLQESKEISYPIDAPSITIELPTENYQV